MTMVIVPLDPPAESGLDALALWEDAPPPGFEVMSAAQLDPLFGTRDRWAYRGVVGAQATVCSGLESRATACRSAWEAYRRGR